MVVRAFSKGVVESEWLRQCAAIERKCFAKHEAMDVAAEARGRGVTGRALVSVVFLGC